MPDSVKVTVVRVKGSAPREVGAAMLVTPHTTDGTIGGGALELEAIRRARRFDGETYSKDFPLGPSLGQCCGGMVQLKFEAADALDDASGAPVAIFGAGHVGQALGQALAPLPFAVRTFDPRADFPGEATWDFDALDPASVILIMTHSHRLDLDLCAEALRRDFPFIGLIGSATKRAKFNSRLRAIDLDPARITCPIGLAEIAGKQPAVIAASVAAQLLARLR